MPQATKRRKTNSPLTKSPLAEKVNPAGAELTTQEMKSRGTTTDHNDGNNRFAKDHEINSFDGDEIAPLPTDSNTQPADKTSPQTPKASFSSNGGYNALKSFNGQVYSGMAVGGSHTWNYDPGVWKETKEEPDLWKIDYRTKKRRAKNAPSGSGAPVGTEYHWLIVAHQYVKKIDANTYETHLAGSKYKLAHKNASSNSWSIPTVKVQRDQEIALLEDAKRRVQGLPPVLSSEKVKVETPEKGQRKLDSLFSKSPASKMAATPKRKRSSEPE